MKRKNENKTIFLEQTSSEERIQKEEFISQENLYSMNEVLDSLFLVPANLQEVSITVERPGVNLQFSVVPENNFSLKNPITGEMFLTNYLWNDIVREEDL